MKIKPSHIIKFLVFIAVLFIGYQLFSKNNNENLVSPEIPTQTISDSTDISALTQEERVIRFLKENHKLPDFYITKNEARRLGWRPEQGNLCEVLPGKAIGGDFFGNREKKLPKKQGRKYFEADINYNCGRRNSDRIVFSNDGLIYTTKDHYKTFQTQ